MAGTVAKFYPSNVISNASHVTQPRTTLVGNMDENDVLSQLGDPSFNKRAEALDYLRAVSRRNGGRIPTANPTAIFGGLSKALLDTNWDVRHQTIQLIHELIPQFGDGLDRCMLEVLPRLVPNLGDSKIAVRRAVIQTLHVYMKYTGNIQQIFKAIVCHGVQHRDNRIKKESIIALPMLFTPEFSSENFFEIAQALAKPMSDNQIGDESMQQHALLSLEKIRNLVGDQVFNSYLHRLPTSCRNSYYKQTDRDRSFAPNNSNALQDSPTKTGLAFNNNYSGGSPGSSHRSGSGSYSENYSYSKTDSINQTTGGSHYQGTDSYKFGIVPSQIMDRLNDLGDFRTRASAVEELKMVVMNLQDTGKLMPHILQFVGFLNNLLGDSHFKITTVTLEILGLLVEKLSSSVKPHLKPLVLSLTKCMGDNKIVVRQAVMKVVMQLMHILTPKPVVHAIAENMSHRNSRVRQETLNILIASLLTFPSYDFDLGSICQIIAHTLVDPKRQVRQASLECFAVLAQAMGAGKLQPLVQAVDSVELGYDGEGVMAAVQARLARRQLPRLSADGLVDYATPVPTSASSRGVNSVPQGADIEWILAASSGSGSSARSNRSDAMELESVTSSARSTPSSFGLENSGTGPTPRRYLSAGKNKARLPWESNTDISSDVSTNGYRQTSPSQGTGRSDSHPPLKPRTTWASEDMNRSIKADVDKKKPLNRHSTFGSGGGRPGSRDPSPETGSYRQIHMNKYKRQQQQQPQQPQQETMVQPFNVLNLRDNDYSDNSAQSTPRGGVLDGYSNSWPESTKMFDDTAKSNRKKLDPITGKEKSPIPTKPTLARGASSSKRKVPPIAVSERGASHSNRDVDVMDSARDSAFDLDDNQSDREMLNSLKQIRNSATKKKAKKIFQGLESKERSPSPPSTVSALESGIFSVSEDSHRKGNSSESPFEVKPKMVRKNSLRDVKATNNNNHDTMDGNDRMNGSDSVNHFDFKPHGGVTFRENHRSDVAIVGKGYHDDPTPASTGVGVAAGHPVKAKRKPSKGMLFDKDSEPPSHGSTGIGGTPALRERRASRTEIVDPRGLQSGVVGVSVHQNSLDNSPTSPDQHEETNQDLVMSMSKTTRERMAAKVQRRQEEVEAKRQERQEREREREKEWERDKEEKKLREKEQLRKLSTTMHDTSPTKTSPASKPPITTTPKRKSRAVLDDSSPHVPSAAVGTSEPDSPESLKPFKDPQHAISDALRLLGNEDWETKMSGVSSIRRLTLHHTDCLVPQLHTVTIAMVGEVKNLRSQVARLAIVCVGEMYQHLRRNMDTDLEMTVRTLLLKNGDTNVFIKEDVEKTLTAMVDHVTPQRAMTAVLTTGASHRNVSVRKLAAQLLVTVVERMGPGRVLSGIKDITDKLLPTAGNFILDGNPDVRYSGQRILHTLMSHDDFDRMMTKHVPASTLRNIQEKLDQLKKRGLGDPPNSGTSATARRSGQGSRSNSMTRGNSASSGLNDTTTTPSTKRRTATVRVNDAVLEEIKAITGDMGCSDWRDRHKGITHLQEMSEGNPEVIGNNIVKVFDKFIPCLKDSNSKVNLLALQVMLALTPVLWEYLAGVISLTVQTVSSNLSSKNREIYDTAAAVLDAFMQHLEGGMLLQPFASQAQSGNARIKPDMIERVAFLVTQVHPRKPKMVVLHTLPLLWHLLSTMSGSGSGSAAVRAATVNMVAALYSQMGAQLLEHATSNSNVTPKMKGLLEEMLDAP